MNTTRERYQQVGPGGWSGVGGGGGGEGGRAGKGLGLGLGRGERRRKEQTIIKGGGEVGDGHAELDIMHCLMRWRGGSWSS